MIIMAFLPQSNIYDVSDATRNLLDTHKVIPNYLIVCINSKITSDPKVTIENARKQAEMNKNKQYFFKW